MQLRQTTRSKLTDTVVLPQTTRAVFSDRMNEVGTEKTNSKDLAASLSHQQPIMEPVVGARCAVLFDLKKDYFGTRAGQCKLESWFPATVERVQRSKQTITARFDDGAVSTFVPYTDVRLLRRGDSATNDDSHLDYWSPITGSNSTGPSAEQVFCNHSPHVLHPGDVVTALFQQGQRADTPNARFRGRVLATRIVVVNTSEWKLADIGYDDGDCERNVPYGASNPHGSSSVSLLQRGIDNPSWLDGLVVPLRSEGFPKCLTGLIVPATATAITDTQWTRCSKNDNTPTIMKTIHYECKGKQVSAEQRSYHTIVTALVATNLDAVATLPVERSVHTLAGSSQPLPLPQTTFHTHKGRQLAALDRKDSPKASARTGRPTRKTQAGSHNYRYCNDDDDDDDDDDDMDDELGLAAFVKKKTALRSAIACTKRPRQATSLREASSEMSDVNSDNEMAESDWVDSDKHQATRKSCSVKRERTTPLPRTAPLPSQKAPRPSTKKNARVNKDHDNVQAVAETLWHLEMGEDIPQQSLPIRSIHNSMAHHLGLSLDSCDAAGASDLLLFMGSMHGRMPNDKLWKSLIALTCLGPSSDGKHFPDVQKMDLCSTYLKFVLSKHGMMSACLNHIEQQFALNHNGVSFADTFVNQMMGEYYTLKGDTLCVSGASVSRTRQSAHAKTCFAELFAKLLHHQLVPCIIADREGKRADYKMLPIIRDIIASRRGAKDVLEKTVRACTFLWTLYGPLVVCNVQTDENETEHRQVDQALLGLALSDVVRLLDSMGIIISCLAWIYGKEAHEGADALADICSQTMFHEFSVTDLGPMKPWWSGMSKETFLEKIKLRFVMSLQSDLIPQVRPKLAHRLEIANLYNLIHGW